MAKAKPVSKQPAQADGASSPPLIDADVIEITADSFRESFGEDLRQTLDVNTWQVGRDLSQEYSRIEREVREAVKREDTLQQRIRAQVFPKLNNPALAPKGAGVHAANLELIADIHRGLLFNGGVEASDGTVQVHDTLPLTIYQIGVSLVSYRGDQGTWCQRLFRRDLRQKSSDPVEEVLEILERRSRRSALNRAASDDALGELAQKAIMDYAERAILLRRSQATWRMGHGNPVTYELLTGAGNLELMIAATKVLRELIEGHQKFLFVASEPRDRMLLTIGQALRPLEYAIVWTLKERLDEWIRQRRFAAGVSRDLDWDGERLTPAEWIPRFIDRVASQVVVGLYRATRLAPAQLFYAHVDHADVAAHIVLADSILQEHRGFPLLIDLADHVCRAVFGDSLKGLTETAYAEAGVPWRYFSERSTRAR
jgi:hypothetical protein